MTEPQFDLDVTLSLFDGISCGQEALKRAGISTRIFLASEIEKYPKMITRKNHPLTVQLGDVTKVVADDLPHVNLLMGGSPCQGFSFAGKQLNFDDPRSALFFEFVRLLKECKPDYFLLENVMMKQEYQDIISEHLGVKPIKICSSLLSAQSRKRLYWTNIPGVSQPQDKGILLKDILEESPEDYTLMSSRFVNRNKDAGCLVDSDKPKASTLSAMEYVKNGRQGDYILCIDPKKEDGTQTYQQDRVYSAEGKMVALSATLGGRFNVAEPTCGRIVGRKINPETGKRDDYNPDLKAEQRLEPRLDEKTGTLTTVQKDNVVIDGPTYRKLTPIECERLQTLPDNYTEGVSNTQRYKGLGNGWTVDVIVHILQGIKVAA